VWSGATALITLILVAINPWNIALALTWLSGSTYARTLAQIVPVLLALVVITPAALVGHRTLDLLALDDDTPRILGVRLHRARLGALVGSRHLGVLPTAALLGATLVSTADSIGRTILAPGQIPAGLVTALVGTPYFVWLLWRSRSTASAR